MKVLFGCVWQIVSLVTMVKLTLLDGVVYNWWNWLIIVPCNAFLSEIWPIYWLLIRPFR